MSAKQNSKAAPKVTTMKLLPGEAEVIERMRDNPLAKGGLDFILAAIRLAQREAVEARSEGVKCKVRGVKQVEAKPAAKRTATRKPKADAQWAVGCKFTYRKADGSESQHRIVRTEGDRAIARNLQGQERPWKHTTLAAMLQTGNVIVK